MFEVINWFPVLCTLSSVGTSAVLIVAPQLGQTFIMLRLSKLLEIVFRNYQDFEKYNMWLEQKMFFKLATINQWCTWFRVNGRALELIPAVYSWRLCAPLGWVSSSYRDISEHLGLLTWLRGMLAMLWRCSWNFPSYQNTCHVLSIHRFEPGILRSSALSLQLPPKKSASCRCKEILHFGSEQIVHWFRKVAKWQTLALVTSWLYHLSPIIWWTTLKNAKASWNNKWIQPQK